MLENMSQNALTILEKRYLLRDPETGMLIEDAKGLFERVAGFMADAEEKGKDEWFHTFYNMIASRDFLPNTPCLVNAGKSYKDSGMSACFVLPIEDDMESIYNTLKDAAIVFKSGGGVGYSFSRLRPKGDRVKSTVGVAGGPVSFMGLFHAMAQTVMQGSVRPGAQMSILHVSHPDIEEFIQCKQVDGALSTFNISVGITDMFMSAVEHDDKWDLINPRTMTVTKTLKARDLWNLIVKLAHQTGDPGLFFLDEANRYNPTPKLGDYESTNPCQPGFATVITPDGIRTFDDIGVGSVIWSKGGWTTVRRKMATGVKKVYAYHTTAGTFYGTDNHRVLEHGKKVKVGKAKTIDISVGCTAREAEIAFETRPQAVIDGLVVGDGTRHMESHHKVYLTIGKNDQDYFKESVLSGYIFGLHPAGRKLGRYAVATTIKPEELVPLPDRVIPDRYVRADIHDKAEFLRGLFSVNGSFNGQRVTLKTTSRKMVEQVMLMLNSCGIPSYFTTNKSHDVKWKNGKFRSKVSYDVNITSGCSAFAAQIGFLQQYKNVALRKHLDNKGQHGRMKLSYEIRDVEYLGEMEVYDITVDNASHTYWTGGLNVSNCGEVVLLPGEPCNLGSINIAHFLRDGKVDYDRLASIVHTAVRFLDNVITKNAYPVPLIKKMALGNRKIGLGIMGWADLLADMGIPYASEKALKLADVVMKRIHDEAYWASEELAKERGAFPNWEESELAKETKVWGPVSKARNSTKLTIAPTGTISNIADCSSGIEPYFALAYKRTAFNDTTALYYFNERLRPHLEKIFDEDERQDVASELTQCGSLAKLSTKWKTRIPVSLLDLFATANDIDPIDHVKMQAAFQRHVDSSISKTINMDRHATVEMVEAAYMKAWKLRCKGITIYRDGSKKSQPLTVEKSVPKVGAVGPRPRQHALKGTTRFIPTGCGPLVVTVNSDDHGIAEVVVKGGKSGGCVSAQVEAIGRLASLAMRSGVPKEKVISQLGGIQCHLPTFYPDQPQGHNRITSCADAIATAMIEAVYETEHVVIDKKHNMMGLQGSCPKCGGVVHNDSGCVKCLSPDCGWSKC